jgi:hypothetical protein
VEQLLFTNNATATLNGSLTQGGTTMVLATGLGDKFPAPGAGQAFLATIYELDLSSNETRIEIVKCTARTADTLTIERDVEETVGVVGGYAYPSAPGQTVYVALRWTAAGAHEMLQANKNLADLASAATARTSLGLGDAATKNTGTGASTVAAGDHNHTGVYEPADATILKSAAIGVSVQAYDANTTKNNVANTFTAAQTFGASVKEKKTAMAANDIDLSAGNFFSKTISGNTTLTVSNVPTTGTVGSFILDLTNGGSATITWWSGMKWAAGVAPTLTAAGRDVLGFFTHDAGTTWTGLVLGRDVK